MNLHISIIIISHDNFETTTGPCLKSLMKDRDKGDFEIIVVDNASSDDTPKKVRELAAGEERVKLVINNNNRGFAGGNNDGAKIARGEILILLNSDTIVLQGTIGKLSKLLLDHPEWGMLGPVTNQAGNEQKIFTRSENHDEIIQEGEEWCAHSKGSHFPSERLDFFCVAIRKKYYDQLGGLDEQFGQGYYEDVDFSLRAQKARVRMMFTEDVFVYHAAGISFSKIGSKKVKKLMRGNKKRLKKKFHGDIKLFHIRDRNLNIMNQYSLISNRISGDHRVGLDYKFNNRLCLAKSMYPNSPLKKLLYYIRIKRICSKYYG